MQADDRLTLTFTVAEWRLIVVACAKVKATGVQNSATTIPQLRALAARIVAETGRS